jgi:hypothetical protein
MMGKLLRHLVRMPMARTVLRRMVRPPSVEQTKVRDPMVVTAALLTTPVCPRPSLLTPSILPQLTRDTQHTQRLNDKEHQTMARHRRSCLKDLRPVLRTALRPLDLSACASGKKSRRPRSKPMMRTALDSMTCATGALRLHLVLIPSAETHPRPDVLRSSAEQKSPGRLKNHESQPAITTTLLKQRITRRTTLRPQANCLLCSLAPARSQACRLLKRSALLLHRQLKHPLHRHVHQRLRRSPSAQLVRWM